MQSTGGGGDARQKNCEGDQCRQNRKGFIGPTKQVEGNQDDRYPKDEPPILGLGITTRKVGVILKNCPAGIANDFVHADQSNPAYIASISAA